MQQNIGPDETAPSRPRRASSVSFEQFTEIADYEPTSSTVEGMSTPESELVDFMRNVWKLPVPELIISVIGGAKLFRIPSLRLKKAFQQDLVSAAIATGAAYLFDDGLY